MRLKRRVFDSLFLLFWISITNASALGDISFKGGDILFQTSMSPQSLAIQRATNSKYSHTGIIFLVEGKPYVLEAVQPVKFTPLREWIARGEKGKFVAKRLKNVEAKLSKEAIAKMLHIGRSFLGKPYDFYFEWSDDRIYCSELVWKVYDRSLGLKIGKLQRLQEFNLSDPLVQKKLRERFGSYPPLQELVISPVAIFDSEELETVKTE